MTTDELFDKIVEMAIACLIEKTDELFIDGTSRKDKEPIGIFSGR